MPQLSKEQLIARLPHLAEVVGTDFPTAEQLLVLRAVFDPATTGVRRLSSSLPHAQIQVPEVVPFLVGLAEKAAGTGLAISPEEIENTSHFMQSTNLPDVVSTQDIIVQRAMMGLPPDIRRAQAAHLCSMVAAGSSVSFVPGDREHNLASAGTLIFVDQPDLTVVAHDMALGQHNPVGVLEAITHHERFMYDSVANPDRVSRLEDVWRRASQLALDPGVSFRAFTNMAAAPAS